MQERIITIYNTLFLGLASKDKLSEICKVSTKTIENTIKKHDDILYSKKLGAYYFRDLMPKHISYQHYFYLFRDNLSNPILKKDMLNIISKFNVEVEKIMIETARLSNLSQKIIKLHTAINHNAIVKISYQGSNKPKDNKIIQANQIVAEGSIYYLYVTYDAKNKDNIGEKRQLAFNSIEDISLIEYKKNAIFKTSQEGNSFGVFANASLINLQLNHSVAHFFKREGLFENPNYKFLSEDSEGRIEMQMIYNNKVEVIKLIQTWMPHIRIIEESDKSKEILAEIEGNYKCFLN
jgi:hypothetical protein